MYKFFRFVSRKALLCDWCRYNNAAWKVQYYLTNSSSRTTEFICKACKEGAE